jgi:4-hydroxy-2-oxoheptanedioate aldolase
MICELMARSDLDYVAVDLQHGFYGYSDAIQAIAAILTTRAVPIVRVPALDEATIGRMLHAGALGIVVPTVESAAQAQQLVDLCYYPPVGRRSVGLIRAGLGPIRSADETNAEVAAIPMIESQRGVAALPEILDVAGIDAVYVGPADLAADMGLESGPPWDDPEFVAVLRDIARTCSNRGVLAGISSGGRADRNSALRDLGFSWVTIAVDLSILSNAVPEAVERSRRREPSSGETVVATRTAPVHSEEV